MSMGALLLIICGVAALLWATRQGYQSGILVAKDEYPTQDDTDERLLAAEDDVDDSEGLQELVSTEDSRSNVYSGSIKTQPDGMIWGFVTLIPAGWIGLWININGRRKDVAEGRMTKEAALGSIKNYMIGFGWSMAIIFIVNFIIYTATGDLAGWFVIGAIVILVIWISYENNKRKIESLE